LVFRRGQHGNTIADPDFNGWFSGRRLQQSLQSALDARQGKA
jgi:hypothetical protein